MRISLFILLAALSIPCLHADGDRPHPKADAPSDGDRLREGDGDQPRAAEAEVIVLEEAPPGDEASEQEKADYWARVREQYESAKVKSMELVEKTKDAAGDYYDKARDATGEAYNQAKDTTVGWYENARDWTQEDLKKAGSWHYRVVIIDKNDLIRHPESVQDTLNELGAERFECFWVEPLDDSHTRMAFFFKKSGFSYLKSIPAQQFWRMLPSGDGGDSGN